MKKATALLFALPLVLAACSSTGDTAPATSSTVATSSTATSASSTPSTSSTTSSATPSSTSAVAEPSTVDQAPAAEQYTAPVAAQPTFVSCWENGYAQLSDMSVVEWPDCALPADEASRLGPGPDPATIPYADGGTCPAYKCGYGHDENGNPNPSNSEIQSWWGDCIATNTAEYCRANDPYQ
ncbi:hypothetical protein EJK80_06280 [Corynebacterium phoceense]|uniref:Secreted protein n=1 Tax=Corynebacterium phoceense TaxID=1686286 RepID=A0A540R7D8_9CORY|nr:hypothetical protein [Corynebacterium phoceense]TQE43612.1 hypothetical protein EJK80_06280 [Corynebacterium phoceense]